jgi:hypothetical protein
MDDLIGMHTSRALAELDLARAARCPDAEQAHLALSGLRLSKARALFAALLAAAART